MEDETSSSRKPTWQNCIHCPRLLFSTTTEFERHVQDKHSIKEGSIILCQYGHTRNISIPDCMEFKITTNACRGYCESWSLPSIMLGFKRHPVTSLGQCCNIMESEDVPFKVLCLDGERNLIFKSAVSCACYHCQKE